MGPKQLVTYHGLYGGLKAKMHVCKMYNPAVISSILQTVFLAHICYHLEWS